MAFNGNSLRKDPETGFLEPSNHYSLTGFTAELKKAFLEIYSRTNNISEACEAAGISRETFYDHVKLDAVFKDEFVKIEWKKVDRAETFMFDRAFDKNGYMYLITWLRANPLTRDKYNPKTVIEHQTKAEDVEGAFGRLFDEKVKNGTAIVVEQNGTSPSHGDAPPPTVDGKP